MPSELSTCPSLPPVAVATAVYRGWYAIVFLRLMFFVAIRNPVIGSTLRLEYRRSLASGATDFQYDSLTRVPGHEMVDKIDAIGEGVLGWKIGQRVGVGFLSITPCETLRPPRRTSKKTWCCAQFFTNSSIGSRRTSLSPSRPIACR